jgi:hypothetical protein
MNEIDFLIENLPRTFSFVRSQGKVETYEYNFDQTNYIIMAVGEKVSKHGLGFLNQIFTETEVENILKQIEDNTFVYEIQNPEINKLREQSLELLHFYTKPDEFGFGIDFDDGFLVNYYLMKLYNQKEIFKAFSFAKSFMKN